MNDEPTPIRVRQPTPRDVAALLNLGVPPVPVVHAQDAERLAPPAPLPPVRERLARGDRVPMLLFAVGGEHAACAIDAVLEVVDAPVLHEMPSMQGALRGMLAVRGALVPAYDPGAVLGLGRATGAVALLVARDGARVALLADDALDAVPCSAADLLPLPAGPADGPVLGALRGPSRLATVVDLPSLLPFLDLSRR